MTFDIFYEYIIEEMCFKAILHALKKKLYDVTDLQQTEFFLCTIHKYQFSDQRVVTNIYNKRLIGNPEIARLSKKCMWYKLNVFELKKKKKKSMFSVEKGLDRSCLELSSRWDHVCGEGQ